MHQFISKFILSYASTNQNYVQTRFSEIPGRRISFPKIFARHINSYDLQNLNQPPQPRKIFTERPSPREWPG